MTDIKKISALLLLATSLFAQTHTENIEDVTTVDEPLKTQKLQEELADIPFTKQALTSVFDSGNADMQGSLGGKYYVLQFRNKKVLAEFRQSGFNEYRLYDLETGMPIQGNAPDLIKIWTATMTEARIARDVLVESTKGSFFDVLPSDKPEVDRASHPVRATVLASIIWVQKYVVNSILDNLITYGFGFMCGYLVHWAKKKSTQMVCPEGK